MDDHLVPFDLRIFKRVANAIWLYFLTANGVTIGVIIATWNAAFNSYALNKGELERLLDALNNGKIDEAYVQTSRHGSNLEDEEIVEARQLHERIKDLPTKEGKLGPFWSLPSLSGNDPM